MSKHFMGTPDPEQCTVYGPRLWIKFSTGFLKGEEKDLYDRIVSLCLWKGEDKVVRVEGADILSFEFLRIHGGDDRPNRRNYFLALGVLREAGYTEVTDHAEFFRTEFRSLPAVTHRVTEES